MNLIKSFLIFENKNCGFVPLFFELDKDGSKYGKFFDISLPGPIFSEDMKSKNSKSLLALTLETIKTLNAKKS